MEDTAVINHRVPAELKRAFDAACKANDQTASQVIRALMRDYVSRNAQGTLALEGKRK
jgi:antitoxin component of RelBE/YafQ-DinJ toxin-antitoxin module